MLRGWLGICLAGVVYTLAILSFSSHTLLAESSLKVSIAQVDADNFPSLGAVVTVLDPGGRPLRGLQQENFQAFRGDQPLQVEDVSPVDAQKSSLAVVLAIDVSGSMGGQPLAQAKTVVGDFVARLSDQDRAMILAFGDSPGIVQELSYDKEAILEAIDGLSPGGYTALYYAVVEAIEGAAAAPESRRAVILLSDGLDYGNKSTISRDDSLKVARDKGVPIFTVALGSQPDQAYLGQLSAVTQAEAFLASTPEELADLYDGIRAVLRDQYLLKVDYGPQSPSGSHSLRVVVTVGDLSGVGEKGFDVGSLTSEPASGRSSLFLLALLPFLLVAAGAGGAVLAFRRKRSLAPAREPAPRPADAALKVEEPAKPLADGLSLPLAHLTIRHEPSEVSRAYVTDGCTTLGSDPHCQVVLADANAEVAPRHARIWYREGKFMLHHLARHGQTKIDGRPITWVVLDSPDEFEIGPYRLHFELCNESAECPLNPMDEKPSDGSMRQ